MNYCYLCGAKLEAGTQQPWKCTSCGQTFYRNPKPAAEVALFNEAGQILLVKRAIEPYKDKYDLPGGFIETTESAEDALARELQEELGLSAKDYSEPQYLTSWIGDYPWGKEVHKNLILEFAAIVKKQEFVPADDVGGYMFVDVDKLGEVEFSLPIYRELIPKAHKLLFGE